jgi:hypothetical protein
MLEIKSAGNTSGYAKISTTKLVWMAADALKKRVATLSGESDLQKTREALHVMQGKSRERANGMGVLRRFFNGTFMLERRLQNVQAQLERAQKKLATSEQAGGGPEQTRSPGSPSEAAPEEPVLTGQAATEEPDSFDQIDESLKWESLGELDAAGEESTEQVEKSPGQVQSSESTSNTAPDEPVSPERDAGSPQNPETLTTPEIGGHGANEEVLEQQPKGAGSESAGQAVAVALEEPDLSDQIDKSVSWESLDGLDVAGEESMEQAGGASGQVQSSESTSAADSKESSSLGQDGGSPQNPEMPTTPEIGDPGANKLEQQSAESVLEDERQPTELGAGSGSREQAGKSPGQVQSPGSPSEAAPEEPSSTERETAATSAGEQDSGTPTTTKTDAPAANDPERQSEAADSLEDLGPFAKSVVFTAVEEEAPKQQLKQAEAAEDKESVPFERVAAAASADGPNPEMPTTPETGDSGAKELEQQSVEAGSESGEQAVAAASEEPSSHGQETAAASANEPNPETSTTPETGDSGAKELEQQSKGAGSESGEQAVAAAPEEPSSHGQETAAASADEPTPETPTTPEMVGHGEKEPEQQSKGVSQESGEQDEKSPGQVQSHESSESTSAVAPEEPSSSEQESATAEDIEIYKRESPLIGSGLIGFQRVSPEVTRAGKDKMASGAFGEVYSCAVEIDGVRREFIVKFPLDRGRDSDIKKEIDVGRILKERYEGMKPGALLSDYQGLVILGMPIALPDGRTALVQEKIKGRNGHDAISHGLKPFVKGYVDDPQKAVKRAIGVALGLHAMHSNGVVHRDLKPANIMIENPREGERDSDYRLRIIDLGAAVRTGEEGGAFTSNGAPELVSPIGGRSNDYTARPSYDMYTLGTMLPSLFFGRGAEEDAKQFYRPRGQRMSAFVQSCQANEQKLIGDLGLERDNPEVQNQLQLQIRESILIKFHKYNEAMNTATNGEKRYPPGVLERLAYMTADCLSMDPKRRPSAECVLLALQNMGLSDWGGEDPQYNIDGVSGLNEYQREIRGRFDWIEGST